MMMDVVAAERGAWEPIVGAIGPKLREARQRLGLSLQQLAARSEVSAAAIHKVERGDMVPTITTLLKLAAALGMPIGHFVDDDGPAAPVATLIKADGRPDAAGVGPRPTASWQVWARRRIPLVAGEQLSPMQRLMTIRDFASAVSTWLDLTRWWFINTELTVHVQREPVGERIGLDAHTVIGPGGVGAALSVSTPAPGRWATPRRR